jgi:hypothetical protein
LTPVPPGRDDPWDFPAILQTGELVERAAGGRVKRLLAQWVAVAAAVWAAAPAVAADEPALATVLARAAAYVADFHRQLSSIVAEEQYVQNVFPSAGRDTWSRDGGGPVHRVLKSDLLLLKPPGGDAWMTFRDVFDVNGEPVRDRTERLSQLFLRRTPSTDAMIRRILDESARYNIGDIRRNVNTPTYPLLFLEAENASRFKFKVTSDRRPGTEPAHTPAGGAFHVSTEVWVIAYQETAAGTMIRTDGQRDLPAKGRFWIEPASGRVLMSELVAGNRRLRATIDVSYQSEPILGLLVPIEMREWYDNMKTRSHIEAVATYGKFRQFQVNTDQTFLIKQ